MTDFIISKNGNDLDQRRLSKWEIDRLIAQGFSLRIVQQPRKMNAGLKIGLILIACGAALALVDIALAIASLK
jgi:hypothetical protein